MRIEDISSSKKKLSPTKSIRYYCRYICCAGEIGSWKKCPAVKCPLYFYRIKTDPSNIIKNKKSVEKELDSSVELSNKAILGGEHATS